MTSAVPTLEQLKKRLAQLRLSSSAFSGTVYRSSTPKRANLSDLLTGEGSRQNGGRWNPIGIAVIYASLMPEIAMAETLAHHRYYGIPIEDAMPRTFVGMETSLKAIIDFRLGSVRQRLQVSLDRILTVDWRKEVRAGREPITQMIGRAAWEIGLEGMIVPSAADPQGHNLLIFPTNLQLGRDVRVLNEDQLRT